jgi:3-phosphoshikimate 1-carboxyvinyltransferase
MFQMALPQLIEIIPPRGPLRARVNVPGSKSVTNRALILAALARSRVELRGALWSEDTQVMVEGLRRLGFEVGVEDDPREVCNRTLRVEGRGGIIPRGGTTEEPLELFVGNAGTAARFLAALVCLGSGVFRLRGVGRMGERPQQSLFAALRQLGYRIDSPNDRLPAVIQGGGPRPGQCAVSIESSSQFASALLLAGRQGGWTIRTEGENSDESPYVQMTIQMAEKFPHGGGVFEIEPDCSSGSYFWAAGFLTAPGGASGVEVSRWPDSNWQIDQQFPGYLPLPPVLSRQGQLGDSIMTAIVLAPFSGRVLRFHDLGRLRAQECERVFALKTELGKCGAEVREEGDTLAVYPGSLRGAVVDTYQDHRMAMCFAVLGLRTAGVRLRDPGCVRKTFPNFFQKLAAPPPHGLGVEILDAASGRKLSESELFAGPAAGKGTA